MHLCDTAHVLMFIWRLSPPSPIGLSFYLAMRPCVTAHVLMFICPLSPPSPIGSSFSDSLGILLPETIGSPVNRELV